MSRVIRKIAIANRGEIARHLVVACQEMGITPVLLYSSADQDSLAYRLSEEKIGIGPGEPVKSYLNISSVIKGALSAGADALHPGYGFLSESPDLALACKQAGVIFIGPDPECLKLFGDKKLSRKQAHACGIPLLPALYSKNPALSEVRELGFPVMIKALHGGGGRGLRLVSSESEWAENWSSAQREVQTAFVSSDLFVEKYLPLARHIEVQVFGDSSGCVHSLGDRDCSLQRKHQKVVESAPAILPAPLREKMHSLAVQLMESVEYRQAGTVEFLCSEKEFYFMEVNPRLQVECPVTEMVLGVDLVKAQITTAGGGAAFSSPSFSPRGYSIQCRIYAEDMQKQLPHFGTLGTCVFPHGAGRRFDMGVESGDSIPPFYDSMLGKVIVWGENRTRALEKMKQTLKETLIFGVPTNLSFLHDLLSHHDFVHSHIHTRFIEEVFLKSWERAGGNSLDPKLLSQIRDAFPMHGHVKKETDFNPWRYFSK